MGGDDMIQCYCRACRSWFLPSLMIDTMSGRKACPICKSVTKVDFIEKRDA